MSSRGFSRRVGGHRHRVAEDLGRGQVGLALVVGVLVGQHLVRPVEELGAVLLRYAEQVGDRLQRQLGRDLVDEVARAALDRLLDDPVRPGRS